MPKSMVITLMGRHWPVIWKKRLPRTETGHKALGWCDPPEKVGKKITIREGLEPAQELEVFIHEQIHAGKFELREEFVDQFAADLAANIIQLGWRKTEGD